MSAFGDEILLLGAAHIDRRARADPPFRPHASNPGRSVETIGGAAFNAATAMRALGRPLAFFGPRGGDARGVAVEQALENAGIRDLGITWLDRATPTYTAITDDKGELVAGIADMELYGLVSPRVLMRRTLREAITGSAALLLDANFPAATLERAAQLAGTRPIGAIGVSPAKVGMLRGLLPRLDALFLSHAEACSLADASPGTRAELIAEILIELGLRRAVVTDGPREAAILEQGRLVLQMPPQVSARDVTGAGDTLAGTAFHFHCAGMAWVECVRRGIAGASLRVSEETFPHARFAAMVEEAAGAMPPPHPA